MTVFIAYEMQPGGGWSILGVFKDGFKAHKHATQFRKSATWAKGKVGIKEMEVK